MYKLLLVCLLATVSFTAFTQENDLEAYKGVYKFAEGSMPPSVEITIQNGSLYASSTVGSAALQRMSKDTFSIPSYNGMMYFSRDSEGKVKGVRVEVNDMILEGTKESAALVFSRRRLHPAFIC